MAFNLIDPNSFSHVEFVEAYREGRLRLSVNTSAAGYLFPSVLKQYAGRQASYRVLAFGGGFAGLIAVYLLGWWSLCFFLLSFVGFKLSRAHTDKSAIKAALESEENYRIMTQNGVIVAVS